MDDFKLYEKTVKRMARVGVKDPTSQIIFLAEEIEQYREKIYGLEALLRAGDNPPITAGTVEVVRCAGCKKYDLDLGFCQFWHGARPGGHWCAEGERRTNG